MHKVRFLLARPSERGSGVAGRRCCLVRCTRAVTLGEELLADLTSTCATTVPAGDIEVSWGMSPEPMLQRQDMSTASSSTYVCLGSLTSLPNLQAVPLALFLRRIPRTFDNSSTHWTASRFAFHPSSVRPVRNLTARRNQRPCWGAACFHQIYCRASLRRPGGPGAHLPSCVALCCKRV